MAADKPIPAMASARIQHWSLLLSAYDYSICHQPGKAHANANTFSRLPLATTPAEDQLTGNTVLLFECLQVSQLSVSNIRRGTDQDPLLAKVRTFVLQGWPMHLEGEEFRPFVRRKDELSVNDCVLLWGSRAIVPLNSRERVIDVLHSTHPGVSRMKSLAGSYVWWPGVDAEIENRVKSCHVCQENLNSPAKAPVHPSTNSELFFRHMAYRKCSCLTMAHHSLVLGLRNLSAGMLFVMSSLHRIILLPTDSPREPFRLSNRL